MLEADAPLPWGRAHRWLKEGNSECDLILKAQIHAGGRGKGHFTSGLKGGVQICTEPDEVAGYTEQMLGNVLVTHQTGPEGQPCNTVLVNEGISIHNETYFAILMDRAHNGPVIVASAQARAPRHPPASLSLRPLTFVAQICLWYIGRHGH